MARLRILFLRFAPQYAVKIMQLPKRSVNEGDENKEKVPSLLSVSRFKPKAVPYLEYDAAARV